jgi:predicted nucleic acid-binding protein
MGLKLHPEETIFLDTAPFIYFFEENETYVERVGSLFVASEESGCRFVTSLITYIEILTLPERMGKHRLAAKYRDFLTNSNSLSIHPLNLAVADEAVRIRARHGLRTPDAIQLATARVCGADHVVTNDKRWRAVSGLHVVLVDEL